MLMPIAVALAAPALMQLDRPGGSEDNVGVRRSMEGASKCCDKDLREAEFVVVVVVVLVVLVQVVVAAELSFLLFLWLLLTTVLFMMMG